MFNFRKLFPRARQRSAEAQFLRFISLNFHGYADVCVHGRTTRISETNDDVAAACREWLPNLSDATHRHICKAIARFHESASRRADALESLMTSLDRLRDEAPAQFSALLMGGRRDVDAVITDSRTGDPVIVDFKTRHNAARTSIGRAKRPQLRAPDAQMLRSDELEFSRCSYCGSRPSFPASFLSGEPAHVCASSDCISQHDRLLRSEYEDFLRVGVVSDTQYH